MITDFDDLCLWTYVTVDDILIKLTPLLRRPGPCPDCSDSELIAMILIAECKGWDIETQLLSEFSQHRHLFPILPCQSRFNRRRRNLGAIINQIRQLLLAGIEAASEQLCIIDSLPIPVIQFHLVPSSTNNWSCYEADYGRVESKKQTIFGYKLHLLVTASGVIKEISPFTMTIVYTSSTARISHVEPIPCLMEGQYTKTPCVKYKEVYLNNYDLVTTTW